VLIIMDNITILMSVTTIVLAIGAVACAIVMVAVSSAIVKNPVTTKKATRWLVLFIILTALSGTARAITPDSKQLAAIYIIPKIANNEDVQAISKDGLMLLRRKIEAYLSDMDSLPRAK